MDGFTGSLLAIVNVAVRDPVAIGRNVTETVHVALTASDDPHVFVNGNSLAFAPVTSTLEMARGAVPAFESVTVWLALVVLSACPTKKSDVLFTPATGAIPT